MTGLLRPHFLSSLPDDLQADALADWHERSAIMEHAGGLSREDADREAALDIASKWRVFARQYEARRPPY